MLFLWLKFLYNMFWSYSFPAPTPPPSLFPTHPTSCSFCQNQNNPSPQKSTKSMDSDLFWLVTPKDEVCPEVWLINSMPLTTALFLSQKQSVANNSWLWAERCVRFPFSTMGFYLVWTCVGLLHTVTVPVSLYGHQACCIWKMFPWSHPPPLALLLPHYHRSLSLEGSSVIQTSHLGLSATKSLTLSTLSSCCVSVLVICCKKLLWWEPSKGTDLSVTICH